MAFGGTLLCLPLAVLGYRLTGSMIVTMAAAAAGWMLSGLPADKYLEGHFAVLKPMGKAKTPPKETPPEPKEGGEEELKEEQA
jgi:hypothetical protein